MKIHAQLLILGLVGLLSGCWQADQSNTDDKGYTQAQLSLGRTVFQNNCAVCHGNQAQGSPDWRKPLADGSYPPPPLNGSAHTWHHPMIFLQTIIKKGNTHLGRRMPGFENQLSEQEIEAVIAYFQSLWRPEIYAIWNTKVNPKTN